MPTNDWKPCEYLKSRCLDLGARLGIHVALVLLQYVKCMGCLFKLSLVITCHVWA
jgi:hypothetical protein